MRTRLFYFLIASFWFLFATSSASAETSCSNLAPTINGNYFCLWNNSTDLTFKFEYAGSNKGEGVNDCIDSIKNQVVYPNDKVSFWFATKQKKECTWGAVSYGIYKNGARIGGLNLAVGNNDWFAKYNQGGEHGFVYKAGQYYGNEAQFGVDLDVGTAGPNFDCTNNGEAAKCSPKNTTGKLNL